MTRRLFAGGAHRGPYGPENPDPAPDCYTVQGDGNGGFIVKHFPFESTSRPCCVVQVTQAPRELAFDALHRAYLHIERKHADDKLRCPTEAA